MASLRDKVVARIQGRQLWAGRGGPTHRNRWAKMANAVAGRWRGARGNGLYIWSRVLVEPGFRRQRIMNPQRSMENFQYPHFKSQINSNDPHSNFQRKGPGISCSNWWVLYGAFPLLKFIWDLVLGIFRFPTSGVEH